MKPYKAHRDERFEYLWDAMHFIEENQCRTCAYSKLVTDPGAHAEDYPMCWNIEAQIIAEDGLVSALEDAGNDGIVCTEYRNAELAAQEHPDQGRLL